MDGRSANCEQKTLWDSITSASSPALGDGSTLCNLPDGPASALCGLGRAPASPTAQQVDDGGTLTNGTSGPRCSGSSASDALQRCLACRLRLRLDMDGTIEYSMIRREKGMPG